MSIESFATQPLQAVIPAYLYAQYSDDANMQAFIDAFNGMAQGYLDWFNDNPLGVYTNPNMTGAFLDWIGTELYGLPRPAVTMGGANTAGEYASAYYTQLAYTQFVPGVARVTAAIPDDIYKRFLTWFLYLGDGKQMSIPWLIRRLARFLYGVNGGDIDASSLIYISIAQSTTAHTYDVVLPTGIAASFFVALVDAGYITLPFQITFNFSIQPFGALTDTSGEPFVLDESQLG